MHFYTDTKYVQFYSDTKYVQFYTDTKYVQFYTDSRVRELRVWPHFITTPYGQPHTIFQGKDYYIV